MSKTLKWWESFEVEGNNLVFTAKEPKYTKDIFSKAFTIDSQVAHDVWVRAKKKIEDLDSLGKELREKIYQKFHEGGISVGKVAELFEVDSEVVGDLIMINIENVSVARGESL